MCIIVYKPSTAKMPTKATLKQCWENNKDGAGYMFPSKDKVIIKKGFMNFKEFYKSLMYDKSQYGEFTPFVLHFRISTQGGVNKECTHPFPLSTEMEYLKKLRVKCECGIAHNGIIELTSDKWNKTVTYSDTMKFITDYLTLIITSKQWYKDPLKVKLIERLADSKLAIMMGDGNVTLIGDFIESDGCFYSNNYFREDRYAKKSYTSLSYREDYDDCWEDDKWYNEYLKKYNAKQLSIGGDNK